MNCLENFLSNVGLWDWVIIFLGVVLIYIIIYIISSIICGRSIVITKLIRIKESNKISNKLHETASQQQTTDQPLVTPEDAIEVAKRAQATAEKAQVTAEKAQVTAEEAQVTAEEARASAEKAKNFISIFYKRKKKELINQEQLPITADQYYYLPTASLVIKATAKVVISRSPEDNIIISADLSELQLENKVVLEPDTTQLYSLKYNSFSFANDELRLNTNASGLLESISSTTEDRISNIIAEISEAPKKILTPQMAIPSLQVIEETPIKNVITETITCTNTFIILSEEFQDNSFKRNWVINVDGTAEIKTTVDASFECMFITNKQKMLDLNVQYPGILTRPLSKLKLDMHIAADREVNPKFGTKDTNFKKDISLFYEITVPDPSVLIQVPIKRAHFVKKIHTPKFSNGLLIENYINKPSEVEAALSIPINILKAIFSIPAQLLSFKIAHIQQETALETARQNLAKAQLLSKQNEDSKAAELLKSRLAAEKLAKSQDDILNAVKDVSNVQNSNNAKNELVSNLQQLTIKKRLLDQLLANTTSADLTDLDIANINNLQQSIQSIQTKIDELKVLTK